LVDRHEDVTHPNLISENPQCARSVTFYGYIRGTQLKPGMKVHLIGVGDFSMSDISVMPDPCPAPTQEKKTQVRKSTIFGGENQQLYSCIESIINIFPLL